MSAKSLKVLIYQNYYKQIGFTKKDGYYLQKKFRKKDLQDYVT